MKRKREPPIERRRRRIQKLLDEYFKKPHGLFWNRSNPHMGGVPRELIKTERGYRKIREGIERILSGDFT